MKYYKIILLCLFFSTTAMAEENIKNNLEKALAEFIPDVEIDSIHPTPIKGLYQVLIGAEVIYMTGDGKHVIKGEILDIGDRRNLTEDVRAESRVGLLNSIKKEEYIEFAGEQVKNIIYVFTDIDCGYCRKLHLDVPELNARGISVRYLAYPRAGVDSEAGKEMSNVWCAEDRQAALTAAKNRELIDDNSCDDPVAEQHLLGQKLGVRGTPSIYLENGRNLPGYMPPEQIENQVRLK